MNIGGEGVGGRGGVPAQNSASSSTSSRSTIIRESSQAAVERQRDGSDSAESYADAYGELSMSRGEKRGAARARFVSGGESSASCPFLSGGEFREGRSSAEKSQFMHEQAGWGGGGVEGEGVGAVEWGGGYVRWCRSRREAERVMSVGAARGQVGQGF